MENEPRYLLVGSVMVAVMLAVVIGLVWLSGGERIAYTHYTIYFRTQSMDGLDVSSPVKLRGVVVGSVTDYAFVSGVREAVRVNIKIAPNTPIQTNCYATVQHNIVTSLAAIDLHNPDAHSPLMTPTQQAPWTVIAEGSSDFDKVTTNLSEVSNETSQALNNINQILNTHNRDAFTHTLDNLQNLSAQLAAHTNDLSASLHGVQSAAAALEQAANHISQTSTHLDEHIGQLTQDADVTLKQTTQTLNSVQQQSTAVSQSLQRVMNTANFRMNQLGSDVHQDTQVIKETGQRLSNPSELLFQNHATDHPPGE